MLPDETIIWPGHDFCSDCFRLSFATEKNKFVSQNGKFLSSGLPKAENKMTTGKTDAIIVAAQVTEIQTVGATFVNDYGKKIPATICEAQLKVDHLS